ncbi:MAG TPA: methyltransferase domain-containing protein, partial [Acetobacteraceae bacterium]|nr:methyltransferase domain-containing protein [Acetobacteraceae bacterium]
DVTVHEFERGRFDLVISRFGVMFFADPVASFQNIRRAMKPGGRFTAAAWRSPAENVWASAPARVLGDLIPPPVPLGPEEPGQFSWADAARVERILRGAGFSAIAVSQHDPAIRLAGPGDVEGATNLTMSLGPVGRALRGENPPSPEAVRPLLEAYFATIDSPRGILLPGAIWIVQAVA